MVDMKLPLVVVFSTLACAAEPVLIVADEIPAMEVLAGQLRSRGGFDARILRQIDMPDDLKPFPAVIVYIHRQIGEPAEKAFIDYATGGGNLILLHHTISSGKKTNRFWLPFLKVSLPEGDIETGGYKWIEGVSMNVVNLAPGEYITTNQVDYPQKTIYFAGQSRQSFRLEHTEVYLNHKLLEGPRTPLLGVQYADSKTGKSYTQDTAGWRMKTGDGTVIYLMPGHAARDFENPAYAQIVTNAVASRK